jgi:hypothetical protein
VIDVDWNKPPYMLNPLSEFTISQLSYPIIEEYSNIIKATLLYKIDLSRLKQTAFANNNNNKFDNNILVDTLI